MILRVKNILNASNNQNGENQSMILTPLQIVLFTCAVVYVIVASKWLRAMSDWRDEQQRRIDDLQCRVNATEEVLAEHLRRMRERLQESEEKETRP
jgi:hypothetical protein